MVQIKALLLQLVAYSRAQAPEPAAAANATAPDVIANGILDTVGTLTFTDVNTSGAGCPHNTVEVWSSNDLQQVYTGQLKDFKARYGPDVPQSEYSKGCSIRAGVTYPQGVKFTIRPSKYQGYAKLDPGVGGSVFSSIYFASGSSPEFSARYDISGGPFIGGAQFEVPAESLRSDTVWSSCGGSDIVTLNTRVAIVRGDSPPYSTGQMEAGQAANQVIDFVWQSC